MTSELQRKANQRNAKKSAGPKTQAGKAAVRQNARKHGLLSRETLLPDEDASAFEELQRDLLAELAPEGAVETLLVERILGAAWRLRRLGRIEVGILIWQSLEEVLTQAHGDAKAVETDPLQDLMREKVRFLDEEIHSEAMGRVEEARNVQRGVLPHLGRSFVRDAEGADTFSKLIRYETSIERSLFRSLHELQRLQAGRRGEAVAAPLALDVSGVEAS